MIYDFLFFQRGAICLERGCGEECTDAIYVSLKREGLHCQLLMFLELLTRSSFSEAVSTTLTPGYKFKFPSKRNFDVS